MSTESNQDQENLTGNLIPTSESTTEVEPEQIIDDTIDQQPTDNTDLVFTDIIAENSVEHKKSKAKLIAFATGVLTLMVGTGALFASFGGGSGKNVPTKTSGTSNPTEETTDSTTEVSETTVSTDGTEVTIASVAETKYDYTQLPQSVVENYYFETLTADQQAEIKRLDAMSDEEFFKVSENDQLKFDYWVLINNKEAYDWYFKSNNLDLIYTENPTTAEQCAQNFDYLFTMASELKTVPVDGEGIVFDYKTAKKLGILMYTLSDVHIAKWSETMDQFTIDTGLMDFKSSIISSEVSGDTIVAHINQTEKNGAMEFLPGTDHCKLVFTTNTTFKTIDDKEVTISRCLSATSETNQ